MEKLIKMYRIRGLFVLGFVTLLSFFLLLALNFSINGLLILMLFSLFHFTFYDYFYKSYTKTKQKNAAHIYNLYNYKQTLSVLFIGVALIGISYLFFIKFYALGVSAIIVALTSLIFKSKHEEFSNKLKKWDKKKIKDYFFRRTLFTVIAYFIIPLYIDFNHLILDIKSSTYFSIVVVYFLLLECVNIYLSYKK